MKINNPQLFSVAAVAAAAFSLAVSPVGQAQEEKVVNVYNWSDYIDESILADFQGETGIRVVYDVFDSNEVLETKLLAGNTGYDVVVPTGSFMERQIQAGAFQKLDQSKLSNKGNQWQDILNRLSVYDPGNAYSVNYMWGTTGIGYNVGMIKARMPNAPVDSLSMLLDPEIVSKFADCGVYMLDAPAELIPATLKYLGRDPASHLSSDIRRAERALQAVRPYVRKFHSSEYINALANGDICLAFGWSGDVLQARDRAAEADNNVVVDYKIPREGALMWFDQMAVPVDAPHPNNAHTFIDYILRPEVIAKASNDVYFANGNLPSQELLNEDVIGDPSIYPPPSTVSNLYLVKAYPDRIQRAVTRAWTRIKSGR